MNVCENVLLSNNLWLAGRLVSSDDSVKLSAPLRLSEGGSKAIGCFSEFIGPEFAIRPGMSQQEMRERVLHRARVWIGTVDKDEPLFIVSVVAASRDAMDFAVVISMSHVIADGYTYGEVLKMLQPEAFNNGDDHADMVVEPLLRFDRVSEFTDEPAVSPPLGFAQTNRKRYKVNMFFHEKLVRPFKCVRRRTSSVQSIVIANVVNVALYCGGDEKTAFACASCTMLFN